MCTFCARFAIFLIFMFYFNRLHMPNIFDSEIKRFRNRGKIG